WARCRSGDAADSRELSPTMYSPTRSAGGRAPRRCSPRGWGSPMYGSLGFAPVGRYEEWVLP
ncbi:MAG: hypothetical protein ACXVXQ_11600, partial [Mycobacteriaceae bacterium]